jgi:hypothetical protein
MNQQRLMQVPLGSANFGESDVRCGQERAGHFSCRVGCNQGGGQSGRRVAVQSFVDSVQSPTLRVRKSVRAVVPGVEGLEKGLRMPWAGQEINFVDGGACIMALVKVKPTSPGRRAVVKVVTQICIKVRRSRFVEHNQEAGRNNNGHMTTRHQGGGHKQHYRLVDFKRNKDGIPVKSRGLSTIRIGQRTCALLYADGERRYVIAPKGMVSGSKW